MQEENQGQDWRCGRSFSPRAVRDYKRLNILSQQEPGSIERGVLMRCFALNPEFWVVLPGMFQWNVRCNFFFKYQCIFMYSLPGMFQWNVRCNFASQMKISEPASCCRACFSGTCVVTGSISPPATSTIALPGMFQWNVRCNESPAPLPARFQVAGHVSVERAL